MTKNGSKKFQQGGKWPYFLSAENTIPALNKALFRDCPGSLSIMKVNIF